MSGKNGKKAEISHDEIQEALRKFREQGGLITRLPDEEVQPRRMVGFRYGTYEPVSEGNEVVGS